MSHFIDRPPFSIDVPVIDTRRPGILAPPIALEDIREQMPSKQEWLWEGYLGKGIVTMMTSLWKAGKTTFVGNLLRAMFGGVSTFLDQSLHAIPTLVITEEVLTLWSERMQEVNSSRRLFFASRPFMGRPSPDEWRNYVVQLAEWAAGQKIGFIVVDPIANLIPGEENAAGPMLDFLLPLAAFTRRQCAVLLLHHPRKSDGTEGRAARGSGALPGFVDIMLEMRRQDGDPKTRTRRLVSYSRYGETPPEMVMELREDGLDYRRIRSALDAQMSYLAKTIWQVLAGNDGAMTVAEILNHWPMGHEPPNRRSVHNLMRAGKDLYWKREGSGSNASPYRYRPLQLHDSLKTALDAPVETDNDTPAMPPEPESEPA